MEQRKRRRTTQQVKDDIMIAVGDVLAKYGVNKLGVEAVANEAGMDKAMLYRHYKDFNDILKHYVEHEDFWINLLSVSEHTEVTKDNVVDVINNLIQKQFDVLLTNNKFQQLLIWELSEPNELMQNTAQKREDLAAKNISRNRKLFPL